MAWYNKFDQMNQERRQREINDASRYGTPNGSFQCNGTITEYHDGNPSSFWTSSTDSTCRLRSSASGQGRYLGNGQYVED